MLVSYTKNVCVSAKILQDIRPITKSIIKTNIFL